MMVRYNKKKEESISKTAVSESQQSETLINRLKHFSFLQETWLVFVHVAFDLMSKQKSQIRSLPFLAHPSTASDPAEVVQNRQVSGPWMTERGNKNMELSKCKKGIESFIKKAFNEISH